MRISLLGLVLGIMLATVCKPISANDDARISERVLLAIEKLQASTTDTAIADIISNNFADSVVYRILSVSSDSSYFLIKRDTSTFIEEAIMPMFNHALAQYVVHDEDSLMLSFFPHSVKFPTQKLEFVRHAKHPKYYLAEEAIHGYGTGYGYRYVFKLVDGRLLFYEIIYAESA
jgi:hypothetical protein